MVGRGTWVALLAIGMVSIGITMPQVAHADGKATYLSECAVCHQADGSGVPGIYPKLTTQVARYPDTKGGREFLAGVLSFGLVGAIETDGVDFFGAMPAFPGLSDAEIAEVLHYLFTELGGTSGQGLPSEVDVHGVRQRGLSPGDVMRIRREMLAEPSPKETRATGADHSALPTELQVRRIAGAREDYARECQGCHRADGRTDPAVVPPLRDFVGYFTHTRAGRNYLIRVPGVAQAPLDDARLARLMNWLLNTYSSEQLAEDFVPYTADEVGHLREQILVEVSQSRAARVAELRRAGVF